MVIDSIRWLSLSYFTYFFSYGIFLPFWSVWLNGIGLNSESIGILLATGLVARFLGSLLIAPRVSDPSRLIKTMRVLSVLTLIFVAAFWVNQEFFWLMTIMIGFNLFFSPLMPLTDALANIWQKQITMDYGRIRMWGSMAFVIGSALVGKLITLFNYQAIQKLLVFGILAMLLGMLLNPSVMPQKETRQHNNTIIYSPWRTLITKSWCFLTCVCLLQGAHAAYYGFSAIYWQDVGYSASVVGYLWSLGVIAEVILFAISKKLFLRFNAKNLLLLSSICGVVRWGIIGWTTELPWLIIAQILHCGSFTVCHLSVIRYVAQREGKDIIRLQSIYSALGMGASIAIFTVFSGFFYQNFGHVIFWIMSLVALLAMIMSNKITVSY